MKKHRIVHTALRYPPALGGVETYVKEVVERTRNIEEGRDVRVLTSRLRTHGPAEELDRALLVNDAPYVQRLHYNSTPFISYPRLQALPYYLEHHKPTIIEAYSFWYQPADVAARYAHKHNIPFIFHPMFYTNEIREKLVWQMYKNIIGKKTFALADVVVVISPQEQTLIELSGFHVKRFELIPPGIDSAALQTPQGNPFLERGIMGDILLSVSRLASGKKLEDALNGLPYILAEFPNAQLVFVGEDFGMQKKLQDKAQELMVESHVHFLGKLSRAELIGAYQHACLLLHPSSYEAFGITLAESLAAGTPVVARNVGAVPFTVPEGKAGLLFTSPDEMIKHVTTLLKNPAQAKAMGQYGKEYVAPNFSWEKSIKKLTALYDEVSQS